MSALGLRLRNVLSSPVAVVTALAFYVFAAWQAVNHLYLMRLPMLSYHLVSLSVETIAAGAVAFFVIRALVDKNRQLEELDSQKNMLTSALVHDLRQPLTAVVMGLSTIEHDANLPEDTREVVAIASRGGADLVEMINDLLDVTKLEAGQPLIQVGPCSTAEFIAGGANALRQLAQRSEIELAIALPPGLPDIQGDCERLRRVVMNLVGNALKFTPSGGRVEVSARSDDARDRMLVSVSDTGEGIPKELQGRIFDKFAVAEARRSPGGRSSTGLGLTFCKLIVEAHGGEIWVESEPGQGSTFTFSLPPRSAV